MSIDNNVKIQTPYNPTNLVGQIPSGARRHQKREEEKTEEETSMPSKEKKEAVEKENQKGKDSLNNLKGKNVSLLI